MKPEIVFINDYEKDGLIKISKEDLASLVDKAYYAGMADAKPITTYPWVVQPTWVQTHTTTGTTC